MRIQWSLLIVLLLLAGPGCKKEPPGRLDNDPANYAKSVKKRVLEFVQEARSNPKGLPHEAPALLETLEATSSAPVGDYKSAYDAMIQRAKALVEASKQSPTSGEVRKLLDDLAALANQLPS